MICPNCKKENQDDAKFCRLCGILLPKEDLEWWKDLKMEPVSIYNGFKPSIFAGFVGTIIAFVAIDFIFVLLFDTRDFQMFPMIGIITTICVCIYISSMIIRYYCLKNIRRKKNGLLDTDFIQTEKERYVFIARGNQVNHRFGLFDVQKMKFVLPPIYEELKWTDNKRTLLSATKEGKSFIIDVNGNQYR